MKGSIDKMGRKMKSARRLLALALAVLMIATLIPITSARVTAATEGHPDSYTVTVTADDETAVKDITEDTEIPVSLVKVYSVTAKFNADGTEETDFESEGGAVTVRPEMDGVMIIASPSEYYCVHDVIIDDKDASDFKQDDYREGAVYTTKLSAINEDHIVTIQFAPIRYSITAIENENGTVTVNPELTVHGSSCRVTVTPEEGYSVQSVTVRGESEAN